MQVYVDVSDADVWCETLSTYVQVLDVCQLQIPIIEMHAWSNVQI